MQLKFQVIIIIKNNLVESTFSYHNILVDTQFLASENILKNKL